MSTTLTAIQAILPNGTELPLRSTTSRHGNTYWAALAKKKDGSRYFSKYGVRVAAVVLGGESPKAGEAITILGSEFVLHADENDRGQSQVKTSGTMVVPGHGKKQVQITITDVGEGEYNLVAKVVGISEGGRREAMSEL